MRVVQSCSKNFAMTGWRIGFALATNPLIKKLASFQSQTTTAAAHICQWAAIGALENADEVNSYVRTTTKRRRDLFSKTFNALFPNPIEAIPSALYAFVPLTALGLSEGPAAPICEKLIASHNVALVPGDTSLENRATFNYIFSTRGGDCGGASCLEKGDRSFKGGG